MNQGKILTIFVYFKAILCKNLANFTPLITLDTPELVYYHSPMSVVGICIYSNQLGMESKQFSKRRWNFDIFSNYNDILGQIQPISPLR